jgi:protein phosphatase 2C family protein 2/3
VYLHGNKPYMRGGDYVATVGGPVVKPMVLNYSRAFGAPALQAFGLSAVPDITNINLPLDARVFIVASDGLWDVMSAEEATATAWTAYKEKSKRSAADVLTERALARHRSLGSCDNVTVSVIIFSST